MSDASPSGELGRPVPKQAHPLRDALVVFLATATAMGAVSASMYWASYGYLLAEARTGLDRSVRIAATRIDGDLHNTLRQSEQEQSDDYRRALAPLTQMSEVTPDVTYIYTIVEIDGRLHFILDAAPPGDHDGDGVDDHSYLMEEYRLRLPDMLAALHEQRVTVDHQPNTDRWGTWISGYAPFYDSRGELAGVVGLDVDLQSFTQRLDGIWAMTWRVFGVSLLVAGVFAAIVYVLQKRAAQASLVLRTKQKYLTQLLAAHERDRQLIAYDIHDGVVQDIVGAKMLLESEERPGRSVELLERALADARRMINNLRPPILDEYGLVPALLHLLSEREPDAAPIELESELSEDRLPGLVEDTCYRIVQEAITNIDRHSGAANALIRVEKREGDLLLEIKDTGHGFAADQVADDRFGLRGIRERAEALSGEAVIESHLGQGTTIKVRVPVLDVATAA